MLCAGQLHRFSITRFEREKGVCVDGAISIAFPTNKPQALAFLKRPQFTSVTSDGGFSLTEPYGAQPFKYEN